MRVLLTNDDGIGAEGLHAARRALAEVEGIETHVMPEKYTVPALVGAIVKYFERAPSPESRAAS